MKVFSLFGSEIGIFWKPSFMFSTSCTAASRPWQTHWQTQWQTQRQTQWQTQWQQQTQTQCYKDINLHIKSLPNISSLHKLAGDCVQGSSSLPKRYIVLGYEIVIDKPGQGRRCCWIPESLRHRWEAWCWRWWDFSAENRNSHPQRLPFPP